MNLENNLLIRQEQLNKNFRRLVSKKYRNLSDAKRKQLLKFINKYSSK